MKERSALEIKAACGVGLTPDSAVMALRLCERRKTGQLLVRFTFADALDDGFYSWGDSALPEQLQD